MTRIALTLIAAWVIATSTSAIAQPTAAGETCDAAEFAEEVMNEHIGRGLCPRPKDPTLERLDSLNKQTRAADSAVFFEVLRSLRDYARATAPSRASWREGLAQQIDRAFTLAKESRLPPSYFAAARFATPDLDPESCLFVTSDAGLPGYACYVLKGAPAPTHMTVYELSDFADAYLAHRALGIALAASLKLEVPALEAAQRRLALASKRWSNLRKRGYLQYPWELALSNVFAAYTDYQACFAHDAYCTGEEGLDPERMRLIALHPGVGMGFSGFGWKQEPSADASLAISLELLGVTYYRADFTSYLGASLGAIVNDGDFRDVRPGVFVHVTRWLHLGYLLSVFRSETRFDGTVFLSTDLGSAFGLDFLD